jgi:hypothetical protein
MVVGVGVLALGCPDFDAAVAATDGAMESETIEQPTTSASTTGTPNATSGTDDTGLPPTTADTTADPTTAVTETSNTTGGCMPGVLGESRFGEACFQ